MQTAVNKPFMIQYVEKDIITDIDFKLLKYNSTYKNSVVNYVLFNVYVKSKTSV